MTEPLRLLLVTDGKPGHVSQLRGLAEAIGRLVATEVAWQGEGHVRPNGFLPNWVVGAGRRTHWPLLVASRRHAARSIVLMRPSLPRWLFDVCVIPRHDGVDGGNVLQTMGVLNDVAPPTDGPRAGGVVLVGGPSKHHGWDADDLLAGVNDAVRSSRESWVVTSSRRTPTRTCDRLRRRFAGDRCVRFIPYTQTPPGWVREHLAAARTAVVTEDSVSMLAEAMTAGCRTVALPVPRLGESRVARFVDQCLTEGLLRRSVAEASTPPGLREADRVAGQLLDRFETQRRAA